MKEKWKRFADCVRRSSWKVRLSALVMGGGQFLYKRYFKGLLYFLTEIMILTYFILRGGADIAEFLHWEQ